MKLAEKKDLIRRSDHELQKNKSLTQNLYQFEAKTRATDEALINSHRELDEMRNANE